MIRTIQSIKGFGVFNDFRWTAALPEFKQFNLIYGWNYSGKTTLSRAFRCFEQQQVHADFADAQVQLKSCDGTIHHLSALQSAPAFRVFNSDFIRENISFDAGSANPILVLGAEDIAKLEDLKAKKGERESLAKDKDATIRKRDDLKSHIATALTDCARNIKNTLSRPNYDKTRFEPKVGECKTSLELHLLGEIALRQNLSTYQSTDKKAAIDGVKQALSPVAELKKRATSLLARVVAASVPIKRLRENPAVERWVQDGRPLHVGRDTCQFCGQLLPAETMACLAKHFSAEYEDLMSEVKALRDDLRDAQKEEIIIDSSKGDFYSALQGRFATEKKQLDDLLETRRSVLAKLEERVAEKRTKAFTSLDSPPVDDPGEAIASAIEALNRTISEHNSRTAEFDREREAAFTALEKHYAALFVRDQRYNERLQEIADLDGTIASQSKTLGQLSGDIRTLEEALSEASKGAGRINELLAGYFGKDDLKIDVSADKRFQIFRGGIVAKNLSEGEKTAIAFAYFITRVQDGRHPLADTRVVIDDPICSLDANHLFNTYALIKTQLTGCRQLFVATHSFEFYSLVRDWLDEDEGGSRARKPQTDWKKWAVFLVKRTDDGQAVLQEIPKELLRFKSEYHYLFSVLYHFDNAGAGDFDCLWSLPNVVRRFMEAFGGIMIPRSTGLKGKMERLFTNEVERERVWKFINYYSHNTTLKRSLTIPDMSECKAIVKACLKAVTNWNAQYYKDLEAEVA
jgi:wobble nucleotide-excising tRNase